MEHGNYLKMNSELIFKHIKNNILSYTITFSAIVHVIGIIFFPSWGSEPDLTKEKIIKIKTILPLPDKPAQKIFPEQEKNFEREQSKKIRQPEPIMPRLRNITPMAKIAKVVAPSPVVKRVHASVNRLNKTYKPMKMMQQTLSTISPSAKFRKSTEINISHSSPIKSRAEETESAIVKSLSRVTHRQISKSLIAVNNLNTQKPTRRVAFKSDLSSSQPTSHARKIQRLERKFSPGPTELTGGAPMVASKQEMNIKARFPESIDSQIHRSTERATPVSGFASASPSGPVHLMQMASIPAEFNEIFLNGDDRANDNTIARAFKPSDEKEKIYAEHLGRIKLAFSSQVRTKIAQTKYYPPTARRRGFEGEPVVTFILGNTGDLLEVSIENPSRHKLLNEAALDAVKSASPYPPIPELLKVKTLRFNLPISFILEGP